MRSLRMRTMPGTEWDLSEYLDKDIGATGRSQVVTENAVIDGGEITMPSDDVVINVYYERNPILPILRPGVPGRGSPGGFSTWRITTLHHRLR